MEGYKRFKDPIYGYIDIPVDYVDTIIDTSEFQRLRRISQTSYSALYSSSVHNRFIHSIGVYYLGTIACESLSKCLYELKSAKHLADWERVKEVFCLACLLHDIGHAPFSHTGEKFFLGEDPDTGYAELHNELINEVIDQEFKKDIPTSTANFAAPHEIMSAIVGLKRFRNLFNNNEEKSLFARCITGYKYSDNYGKHGIYNCFISILNSKVIDVDRLDYLMRDAYFTGYKATSIDYQRLLTSLIILEDKSNIDYISYSLGYTKHAISIIESVVFAHDAERKWIQSHPIVLYEMYIIQHILDKLDKKFSSGGKKLFSSQTLSKKGDVFPNIGQISLLCDDDIIHLVKTQLSDDDLCMEFFERSERRHPVWKGESEYNASFTNKYGNGSLVDKFYDSLSAIEKYITKNTDTWVINDDIINTMETELSKVRKLLKGTKEYVKKMSFASQIGDKAKMLPLLKALRNYSRRIGIECDFVILNEDSFYSNFNKEDFGNIKIRFDKDGYHLLSAVLPTLSGTQRTKKPYFYIYYKKSAKIDKNTLRDVMIKATMKLK